MNKSSHSKILAVALEAVKETEKIILDGLSNGVRSELKADLSPVTSADRGAEERIRQIISAEFPDHTFYGEEGEKTNLFSRKGSTWIIDPIDGTKNYIRGIPLFGTQLALYQDGEFVLGVSNAPLMNELMYAEKGRGAYLNGEPVHVSQVSTIEESYLSFGSPKYFVRHDKIQQLLDLTRRVRWPRGIGDCWSYHLLAAGKIDAVVEAKVKMWDIAAVKIIVEEAGGKVTGLDGKPVGPGTSSVLASNDILHDELVKLFNP